METLPDESDDESQAEYAENLDKSDQGELPGRITRDPF
jgi:hypothetical protein